MMLIMVIAMFTPIIIVEAFQLGTITMVTPKTKFNNSTIAPARMQSRTGRRIWFKVVSWSDDSPSPFVPKAPTIANSQIMPTS
jgi:hypothetical protein